MKHYTVDDIMKMGPCEEFSRDRVSELFGGRETVTANDIGGMDIDIYAKEWVLTEMFPLPEGFKMPPGITVLRIQDRSELTTLTARSFPGGITDVWVHNCQCLRV